MQHKIKINIYFILILFLISNPFLLTQIVKMDAPTTVNTDYHYGSIISHFASVDLDMAFVKIAETKIINALKKYPDVPAHDLNVFLKANVDLRNGNYHIAIKELEIFIKERNNSPFVASALLFSGYIEFEAGNYSAAANYFQLTRNAANTDKIQRTDKYFYETIEHRALYWLAISMCHQGKYLEAIPYFVETQKNFPDFEYAAQSLYALGSIAEMNKEYASAIEYYEKIETEYPYSNVILAALVRNANDKLLLRNPHSALLYIQKTESTYHNIITKKRETNTDETDNNTNTKQSQKQDFNDHYSENILYLKGEAYNQIERYDLAISHFEEVLRAYPKSELLDFVNMGIGWAYLNKSDFHSAIKYFDAVIDSKLNYSPNDNISNVKAIAYLNKISALKKLNKIDEAQTELSLLAVRPNFPQLAYVQLELSQIYYEKGDYDLARKTLERAEREADNPKVLIRITSLLGASYLEVKQYVKAVESYKRTEQIADKETYLLIPNKN
jgi:tetratricopeptide (TPR) repeat protein